MENVIPLTMYTAGTINFDSFVDITDPSYRRDVWCRMNNVEIAPGTYTCMYWKCEDKEYEEGWAFNRVLSCGIYLDGQIYDRTAMEQIGTIGVDGGVAGFVKSGRELTEDELFSINKMFLDDSAFITESGYGDGEYPVYAFFDDNENIVALEIDFS